MSLNDLLFSFTFVFGTLKFFSYLKFFSNHVVTVVEAFTWTKNKVLLQFGYWVFYLSLIYQSYFWFKYFNVI